MFHVLFYRLHYCNCCSVYFFLVHCTRSLLIAMLSTDGILSVHLFLQWVKFTCSFMHFGDLKCNPFKVGSVENRRFYNYMSLSVIRSKMPIVSSISCGFVR